MIEHFYYARKEKEYLLTRDTGEYCFLTEEEFQTLKNGKADLSCPKGQELVAKGFAHSDSRESYLRRNESRMRDAYSYLFDPTSLFILAVTNTCNNRCVYCQANGGSKAVRMTMETAEQALKRIAQSPARRITIEFQGGEPLMNEPVIRYVVDRGKDLLQEKNVQYTVVSNLALLTEDTACYFRDRKVSVSTSLDGPAFLHDKNRPGAHENGSFENTIRGIEILRRNGIDPGAIETTTAYSLPYAEEIVDTYIQLGFHQLFLRPLTRLGAAARSWNRIGYTAAEFIDFYRRGLERILWYRLQGQDVTEYHAALFLSKILRGKAVNYMELRSPCGAGIGQMAITANGNVYTCDEGRMMAEAGDEAFLLGNVFTGGYEDWIEAPSCKAVCAASLLDTLPGCCDCVYKPYCGVCPVVNYAINGSTTRISEERCRIYKGILDILFEYLHEGNPEIEKIFSEWSERV